MSRYPRFPGRPAGAQARETPEAPPPSRWATRGLYASWLAGYALVVWALGGLLSPWLWPLGIGVALLGFVGLRQVGLVLWRGGYFLGREGGSLDRSRQDVAP